MTADELGAGPWGQEGSPTRVGRTRAMHHERVRKVLSGTAEEQVAEALALLEERGALSATRSSRLTGRTAGWAVARTPVAAPLPLSLSQIVPGWVWRSSGGISARIAHRRPGRRPGLRGRRPPGPGCSGSRCRHLVRG